MNSVRSFVLLTVLTFLSAPVGIAQEKATEQLGKVTFPTSCDPKVQAQFERGVAMLHSYWFTEGGKVFDARGEAGSQLRHGLLGLCRQSARQFIGQPPVGERRADGLGGA